MTKTAGVRFMSLGPGGPYSSTWRSHAANGGAKTGHPQLDGDDEAVRATRETVG